MAKDVSKINSIFAIAHDTFGNRVSIDETKNGKEYFCPLCGERVICKKGKIKRHHFSHTPNSHCHDWGDMSDWHREWQEMFPKDYREVVIKDENEMHRADILVPSKKVVIEFQHSPIDNDQFNRRNRFYTNLGYTLVWVFDAKNALLYDRYKVCSKPIEYNETQNIPWKRKKEWNYKLRHDKTLNVKVFLETNFGLYPYKQSTDDYAEIITLTSYISRDSFVQNFLINEEQTCQTIEEICKETDEMKKEYERNIYKYGSVENWKDELKKAEIERKANWMFYKGGLYKHNY